METLQKYLLETNESLGSWDAVREKLVEAVGEDVMPGTGRRLLRPETIRRWAEGENIPPASIMPHLARMLGRSLYDLYGEAEPSLEADLTVEQIGLLEAVRRTGEDPGRLTSEILARNSRSASALRVRKQGGYDETGVDRPRDGEREPRPADLLDD